jgi:hypothetical protein
MKREHRRFSLAITLLHLLLCCVLVPFHWSNLSISCRPAGQSATISVDVRIQIPRPGVKPVLQEQLRFGAKSEQARC